MDINEIFAVEYAVAVFNELCEINKSKDFKPFKVAWDTSLGLATFKPIHLDDTNYPIITEELGIDGIFTKHYTPGSTSDLFGLVRKQVVQYFLTDGFSFKNLYLRNRPDVLLNELSRLSKINVTENLMTPNYSAALEFELLDGSIKLPFISLNSLTVKQPVSLISEN